MVGLAAEAVAVHRVARQFLHPQPVDGLREVHGAAVGGLVVVDQHDMEIAVAAHGVEGRLARVAGESAQLHGIIRSCSGVQRGDDLRASGKVIADDEE